jgi:hypothetical protein
MKEALKLALEALEGFYEYGYDRQECFEHITAIKEALAQSEQTNTRPYYTIDELNAWADEKEKQAWRNAAIRVGEELSSVGPDGYYDMNAWQWLDWAMENVKKVQPKQEPVTWKLMPREATREMLEAMDECSTEGYDERLYAGHAASVYMAAWDAQQPQPEQYITDAMKVRQAVAQALLDDVYAEELEQPEAKQSGTISITMPAPVAYLCENAVGHKYFRWKKPSSTYKPIPLYTTPPQRKPLTDERIADIVIEMNGNEPTALFWRDLAQAIEAAHGIKE